MVHNGQRANCTSFMMRDIIVIIICGFLKYCASFRHSDSIGMEWIESMVSDWTYQRKAAMYQIHRFLVKPIDEVDLASLHLQNPLLVHITIPF